MLNFNFPIFISLYLSVFFYFPSLSLDSCKPNEPCVFMGKNDGNWAVLDESKFAFQQPYPPASDSWKRNDTTFHIAISSFRDKLCPRTLYNIFKKASYPRRIKVGVVQQNTDHDIDCLEGYCSLATQDKVLMSKDRHVNCPFRENILMTRVDASSAEGPVWARSLGSKMIRDEEFCLQIDAHMDFANNFDTLLLSSWALTENEYAVLSTYVSDVETMKDNAPGGKGLNNLYEVMNKLY